MDTLSARRPCTHEGKEICNSLQDGANRILKRMQELLDRMAADASDEWERAYECRDLRGENGRLKERLDNSIPLDDWGKLPGAKLRTALEADQEDLAPKLQAQVKDLQKRHHNMAERLQDAMSKNWELDYKCRDLSGDISRLKGQLRNSVMSEDSQMPSLKPKTALETDLEKEIRRLKEGNKQAAGRSRSRSM
ncbi:hypothetical protein B0T16DRAFT_458882 [Cercophora newfieldiana]|uniref:Uncharacterized protein n=1 Tax=Cercophora newfieldiana TaxID=92897 RepID=A0AA40CPY4_9PEZI|nr:hypothetical protein B0T16DRAFT_458882 [Cercophora newfieldiana]